MCHLKFSQKQALEKEITSSLMSLLISLNADSDMPVDEAIHTDHLINLISTKRQDANFFNAQQDCHEIIVILLGLINEISESTRVMTQTLSCHLDDFGGSLP